MNPFCLYLFPSDSRVEHSNTNYYYAPVFNGEMITFFKIRKYFNEKELLNYTNMGIILMRGNEVVMF